MAPSSPIAHHLRAVFFGGNWTGVCLRAVLEGVTWQQATARVASLHPIGALVFHIGYYLEAVLGVLRGQPLTAHDRYSFDHPPLDSPAAWQKLLTQTWANAEAAAALAEQLPEAQLGDVFGAEKYGTYYRNLHGLIEHTHYHLGQIVLVKKLLGASGKAMTFTQ